MEDLMRLDAMAQAELVRNGEVSASELVEASIDAIEQLNPEINAVVTPMFESARKLAKSPEYDGPFAGVPLLLKDMLAEYEGAPMTEGSRFLKDYVSPHDTELVTRYRRAGFIVVGKTNTPEFASKPTTEPELFGATRNPWDTTLSTGGSSGGSAAAVAAGMAAAGHANDGGGSIRCPAAWCGLVGLKPTRGRNPLGPDYGDMGAGLIHEHVVTRTVRDTAAILDVTAGPDLGAPYYAPPPKRPFIEEVGADPGKLRVCFSTRPVMGTEISPECEQAVRDAAALCAGLGHTVEHDPPTEKIAPKRFSRVFTTIWLATIAWAIRDWARKTGQTPSEKMFEAHTWKMFTLDNERNPSDLFLAIQDMHAMSREIARHYGSYDVWLTPTLTQPPMPLGYFDFDPSVPRQMTVRMEDVPRFTAVANFTGQPGITLPLHWTAEGLPVGIQLLGRYGDEATILRLSAQLEAARPWIDRRPGVCVGS
jgi:amidase